ncbi:MAG: ribonuclease [Caulobacter sp.]|nr:ribonuclease [Caulobacter sp.]
MKVRQTLVTLATALLAAACTAPAEITQAPSPAPTCALPATITPAPSYTPPADEVVADEPTALYMLALTWAPEECHARAGDPDYATQCRTNAFGFVVHGLWPNGAQRRHPRYCGPAPAISPATVRRHSCMTPSPVMLQHEWAAHGTCGWETPEAYFEQAADLWDDVRQPVLSSTTMTAGAVRDAFVAANPWMKREGIYIKTVEGDRLMDVRVCYDLRYWPMACLSIGAPDRVMLTITPKRAG